MLLKLNPEMNEIKENIKKVENSLSLKISSKDLSDLKEKLNLQNMSINNLRDNVDRISELSNKAKNDIG